ncbi:MAG: nitrate- and nitrite sensing domain-containing protein [Streptosporangiaceae bacterium]|nr:nitrate- and nitrite sensing domain-containing protein [Streptosporangiaceae bacterium]MBV9856823.1 nitrate- and nitrite sensing domain-containing protein [Streptosporangiaceae bacterium]
MGSRGRSIRLRIYFLVAIPLITMVGLFAYVTTTTVHNAINLDRAPALISATSLPAAHFVTYLQNERTAAVVYLFDPTPANLQQYMAAINATDGAEPKFVAAMHSPATMSSETPSEADAINKVVGGLSQLQTLRQGVEARALSPLQALGFYSQGVGSEPKLFLVEADSLTDAFAGEQALGLIATVTAREDLEQEDALLSGMLAAAATARGGNFPRATFNTDRTAFAEMAANRASTLLDAEQILTPTDLTAFVSPLNKAAPAALQTDLTDLEGAVSADATGAALPVTQAQWHQLAQAVELGYFNGGVSLAGAELAHDHTTTHGAWVRVAETSILGLLGLILTILATSLVGRGIIRRLGGLRSSALALAEEQLPSVVSRLRHGETVDIAAEAPPIRTSGDEIGQVAQAFDTVRQTAVRAAVEESRLRQGINDVFRNLARRNQSLLHRQLTVLDAMERRATDPEALDDLFRLDHLTTRMRRHAEGLIILSGAPPGRGWSNPVRLIDVMRGAVAEVEDYARVTVVTQSKAALSGSAVTDVIHLLAELIENATTLSPPYTTVRVAGEMVGNGFAIEIEDRGLGMSAQRLAELNERLASPAEFNPANSEQLGLFVVGQLARRHGIRVTLRPSPYGGTTAVALIPSQLVVVEEAVPAGLPAGPAALPSGRTGGATGPNGPMPGPMRPVGPVGGAAGSLGGPGAPGGPGGPGRPGVLGGERAAGITGGPFADGPESGMAGDPPFTGFRISGAVRQSLSGPQGAGPRHATPGAGGTAGGAAGTSSGTPPPGVPVVPGIPLPPGVPVPPAMPPGSGRVVPGVTEPADFDVFTPLHRGTPQAPGEQPRPGNGNGLPGNGNGHGAGAPGVPGVPGAAGAPQDAAPAGGEEYKGLPRRVRQASLAPQLRRSPPGAQPGPSSPPAGRQAPGAQPAAQSVPSLAEIRSTMSAMQRGWQQGRTEVTSNAAQQQSRDQEPPAAFREPGAVEPAAGPEDGRRLDGA